MNKIVEQIRAIKKRRQLLELKDLGIPIDFSNLGATVSASFYGKKIEKIPEGLIYLSNLKKVTISDERILSEEEIKFLFSINNKIFITFYKV